MIYLLHFETQISISSLLKLMVIYMIIHYFQISLSNHTRLNNEGKEQYPFLQHLAFFIVEKMRLQHQMLNLSIIPFMWRHKIQKIYRQDKWQFNNKKPNCFLNFSYRRLGLNQIQIKNYIILVNNEQFIKYSNNQQQQKKPEKVKKRKNMGSNESSCLQECMPFEKEFQKNYNFIQLQKDQNYGFIKIYRKKQLNYDYVMIYDECIFGLTHEQKQSKLRFIRKIKSEQNETMLKILHYKIVEQNKSACKYDFIRYYVEYYNLTLDCIIKFNQKNQVYFSYEEILYILNTILVAYKIFLEYNIYEFSINSSHIFLSTLGVLFFSPFPIKSRKIQQTICGTKVQQQINITNSRVSQLKYNKLLKTQFKKLLLTLTANFPKSKIQAFHQIFSLIQKSDNLEIVSTHIPKSKLSSLNLEKQIFSYKESSETSEVSLPFISKGEYIQHKPEQAEPNIRINF